MLMRVPISQLTTNLGYLLDFQKSPSSDFIWSVGCFAANWPLDGQKGSLRSPRGRLIASLVTYQLSLSYSAYYSVITRIFFTSARQSILGVGPTKFRFKLT